ncbi:MAG: EAL domain-containing protein [Myxococcales bacterium]|nr:EAL domain-containing protein [Myxococcales bacterium]
MRTVEEVIAADELYIAYQPVVDLNRKEVFAYEALVRSHAEEFPNPFVLIEAAVEQRAMGMLGRHLRRLAVEGCSSHRLFLNIHPDEFSEPWLVRPDDSMTTHGREIYLEITESVPLSHYEHCHSVLAEMRTRGAKVAVDDLGAGFSNLKYIVDLEPEVVKLDRELVANLRAESRLYRLVAALVQLCAQLDARVVAEGIETEEELAAVIDAGVHFGQGYLLQRPNPELIAIDWTKRL